MRPRLVTLANLAADVLGAVRSGAEQVLRGARPSASGQDDAAEMKRRLDATHERLKREIPPGEEPPGEIPPD